jgi:hypothetical protein
LRNEERRLDAYERRLDERDGDVAFSAAQRTEIAAIQRRAETVYSALSKPVPKLNPGERPLPYRVRLAADLQRHSKDWARVDLAPVARSDPSAFGKIEQQVYAAAERRGLDWGYAPGGGLRARVETDAAGTQTTVFHGDIANWINQFATPTKVTVRKFWDGKRRQIYPK